MTQLVVWLNGAANGLGRVFLSPVAFLPGWLSATLVGVGTGIAALIAFKYTSHQRAIGRTRSGIRADLLALSLFKDNVAVLLRAQGGILLGALKLLALAFVPMLVMLVPMTLLLGQLALWFQARPLAVGEETVITVTLKEEGASTWPDVRLEKSPAIEPLAGPVRIASQRRLCWSAAAREMGTHRLAFTVNGKTIDKEIAVGEGFARTSPLRPAWRWSAALLHPWETPFFPNSPVQSIEIVYPERSSFTTGSQSWIIYWFVVSMVAAFAFRRVFHVNF